MPAESDQADTGGAGGDSRSRCRLYLITPPSLSCDAAALAAFGDQLTDALDAGDVACVQLRLKDVSDDDWRRAAATLMPIVQARNVAFILNDRADLAAELQADGVHVGQDDLSLAEARRLVGPDAIVGVTCKDSRDLAVEASEAGADYVAFGAFFDSRTKPVGKHADVDILRWWSSGTNMPSVAIGGVTAANCPALVTAGADFLAISGAVWLCPEGPAAAIRSLNAAIDATPHSG